MKKFVEISSVIAIGFFYLLYIIKLELSTNQSIMLIECAAGALEIIFIGLAMVIVFTNLNMDTNYRIGYLVTSYFILIFLIILKLNFCKNGGHLYTNESFLKLRWFINLLEISFIYICRHLIHETKDLLKWLRIESLLILGSVCYLLSVYSPIDWLINTWGDQITWYILESILMSMICIEGFFLKKLVARQEASNDKVFWIVTTISLFVLHIIRIVAIDKQESLFLCALANFFNVISYGCILCYIESFALNIVWKVTEQGIGLKQQQLEQETLGNKLLIKATEAIKNEVKLISRSAQQFKESIPNQSEYPRLRYVDKIMNNCNRLMKLSNNILELNTIEKQKKEKQFVRIDLCIFIENLILSLEPYMEKTGIKLQCITCEYPVFCYVDCEAIERVLFNLISNAIKYNKKNGEIKVFINQKGQMAYLCIQDTGTGIPVNKLNSVFNRFDRGDTTLVHGQEGSGLGLAIVKSIVDLHHGEIRIMSKENKGTQICISLPVSKEEEREGYQQLEIDEKTLKNRIQVEFSDLEI